MKKALLLALAGLFAAVAPALAYPPAAANVNFASERGVPFGLVLDGRPLTRGMARQVHVDQLVPGLHWADFTLPTAYGGAVRFRSRVWLEPGLETTFVLLTRPGRPLDLRQVNAVVLYGPTRGYGPGYNGDEGSYHGSAPYGQGPNQGGYSPNNPYSGGYNNNGYGNNSAPTPNSGTYSNAPNGGYSNAPSGPNGSYNNAPNNPNGSYNNNPNNANGGYNNTPNGTGYYPGSAVSSYRAMALQDVDALVQAVKQRSFEAGKLSTAKEALNQSSIQADDVKRLLRSLDFEASRVELAKFAYPHVTDPQNFFRVYDAFDFEASVQEVQQAVGAAPEQR